MKIGIVEILGAEEVNDLLEREFEKEISTLELKRKLVPTIDDSALGAKILFDDEACDAVVIGYALEEGEKLSQAFQHTVLKAQYEHKKHIFRVMVPFDHEIEIYAKAAAKEIIRYFYKPTELQKEKSAMAVEERREDSSFNPFALFG